MQKIACCALALFCLYFCCGCREPSAPTIKIVSSSAPTESPSADPSSPLSGYTIAVDAGHGGRDVGTQGRISDVTEAELNLCIARELRSVLQENGAQVIMTRDSEDIAYAQGEGTFKQREMEHRAGLVNDQEADLLISVHMNFFEDGQYGGAQAFFCQGSSRGQQLANCIQTAIVSALQPDNNRKSQAKDFYMLRETTCPAVLVECGFLSNETDEANLQKPEYQGEMARCIVQGILDYLAAQESAG